MMDKSVKEAASISSSSDSEDGASFPASQSFQSQKVEVFQSDESSSENDNSEQVNKHLIYFRRNIDFYEDDFDDFEKSNSYQDFCNTIDKKTVLFLNVIMKVLKNVFLGKINGKVNRQDSFVLLTHKEFLEEHFANINLKKMKRGQIVDFLKSLSSISNGQIMKILLKYRTQL